MQRYKILLVDDETDVRQSIARTVDWEAEGFVLAAARAARWRRWSWRAGCCPTW